MAMAAARFDLAGVSHPCVHAGGELMSIFIRVTAKGDELW